MDPAFQLFLKRQGLAHNTQRTLLSRADKLIEACDPFTKQTVDEYLCEIADQYSNATVNKYVQAARKICAYKELNWGKKISRIKERAPRRSTMSDDEIEAFIGLENATERSTKKYRAYWSLVAYTGARPSEILGLSVKDFDVSNDTVTIRDNKSNDYRVVPVPKIIRQDVYPYIKDKEDKIFNVSYRAILKEFHRRIDELGIKRDVTPYSLRHSFITRLVGEADLFDVQSIVGHKKANTTQIYVHKNLKSKRKAIKRDPLSRKSLSAKEIINEIKKQVSKELEAYGINENKDITYSLSESSNGIELKISVK